MQDENANITQTHEPTEDSQHPAPALDHKADHEANHHDEKVDGCEYC